MQLTRAADYAVRVMIHLSTLPEGSIVSKGRLAKAIDVPESFLSKILQALARAGMIQARRGVDGGFSLQSRGATATLLEVIEIIDGPIALNICLSDGDGCNRHAQCPAHLVWTQAQQAMLAVLTRATIADMANNTNGKALAAGVDNHTDFLSPTASKAASQGRARCATNKPTNARCANGAANGNTQDQLKIME
jgi:Rrf2 family protein